MCRMPFAANKHPTPFTLNAVWYLSCIIHQPFVHSPCHDGPLLEVIFLLLFHNLLKLECQPLLLLLTPTMLGNIVIFRVADGRVWGLGQAESR